MTYESNPAPRLYAAYNTHMAHTSRDMTNITATNHIFNTVY